MIQFGGMVLNFCVHLLIALCDVLVSFKTYKPVVQEA